MCEDQTNSLFSSLSLQLNAEAANWIALTPDEHATTVFVTSRLDAKSTDGSSHGAMERVVKAAEDELRRRKMRARFLPAELFGEGAWSMLLDLFVSQYRGRKVSTTSACLAADVPPTTALRWLELLEARGLVERTPTTADKRVKYVSLTAKARDALYALLARQLA